jgi:hypothetical protein
MRARAVLFPDELKSKETTAIFQARPLASETGRHGCAVLPC